MGQTPNNKRWDEESPLARQRRRLACLLVLNDGNTLYYPPDHVVWGAEVSVSDRHALLDVKETPSSFYKIVLEAPDNVVNKWIMLENTK